MVSPLLRPERSALVGETESVALIGNCVSSRAVYINASKLSVVSQGRSKPANLFLTIISVQSFLYLSSSLGTDVQVLSFCDSQSV